MTREASIEQYLVARTEAAGGFCVKLNPTGKRGIPDRLLVLPGGATAFVELKRPKGGVVDKLQWYWHRLLLRMGHRALFAQTKEEVDAIIAELVGDREPADGRPAGGEP